MPSQERFHIQAEINFPKKPNLFIKVFMKDLCFYAKPAIPFVQESATGLA